MWTLAGVCACVCVRMCDLLLLNTLTELCLAIYFFLNNPPFSAIHAQSRRNLQIGSLLFLTSVLWRAHTHPLHINTAHYLAQECNDLICLCVHREETRPCKWYVFHCFFLKWSEKKCKARVRLVSDGVGKHLWQSAHCVILAGFLRSSWFQRSFISSYTVEETT